MANEEWMTNLPEPIRNISIINIAIPGSHNSMTYEITSELGPDADAAARRFNCIFPCFVRRWAKTQSATVLEQLQLGIRFFDLRVCQVNGKFYYTHGLLAMEVFAPLEEMKQFLTAHSGEVVVLDFQHHYGMDVYNHQQLHARLIELFGSMLYTSADGALMNCTLNYCRSLGRQVLLIYRRCPISLPNKFWPSYSWPTPWPNTASVKKLREYLQEALLTRKNYQGFVSQCIITPSGRYIALRFFSSVRRTAKRVEKKLHPWIVEQYPGPFNAHEDPKVNVFLADFVDLHDGQFPKWVIGLNAKLYDYAQTMMANDQRDNQQA